MELEKVPKINEPHLGQPNHHLGSLRSIQDTHSTDKQAWHRLASELSGVMQNKVKAEKHTENALCNAISVVVRHLVSNSCINLTTNEVESTLK